MSFPRGSSPSRCWRSWRSVTTSSGASVLYVTAEGAREVLPRGLEELGAKVSVIEAYRSINDAAGVSRLVRALEGKTIDLVTFTSASSVRGYVEAVGPELSRSAPAASIGPSTTAAIEAAGIEVRCEPGMSTIEGLVDAIKTALE